MLASTTRAPRSRTQTNARALPQRLAPISPVTSRAFPPIATFETLLSSRPARSAPRRQPCGSFGGRRLAPPPRAPRGNFGAPPSRDSTASRFPAAFERSERSRAPRLGTNTLAQPVPIAGPEEPAKPDFHRDFQLGMPVAGSMWNWSPQ